MAEFSNAKDFEAWLKVQPREWAVVLAARSALRVLPLLWQLAKLPDGLTVERRRGILLPLLRGIASSWAAAKYPALGQDKGIAARAAAVAAAAVAARAIGSDDVAVRAANAAANAAFAAAVSAPNAAVSAVNAAVNAANAARASNAAAVAADIWSSVIEDANELERHGNVARLAGEQLWFLSVVTLPTAGDAPPTPDYPVWIAQQWTDLQQLLRYNGGEGWDVWIDWYEAVLNGRPVFSEAAETEIALLPDKIWKRGPAVVNAEIARIRGGDKPAIQPDPGNQLPEPEEEPGPELEVSRQGLSIKITGPAGAFDEAEQRKIHERLKRVSAVLADVTRKVGNERPALDMVVSEYNDLISASFEELDISALWSIGTGVLANAWAFEPDRAKNSSRGQLEPDHFALLKQAAEMHGGFILGFPKGRELTERADQSRIAAEAMEGIVANARVVLRQLRESTSFVDAKTRKFFGSIEDSLIEPGWKITRAGYAAYAVTRNALIAIGRFLGWANSAFSTVAATIMVNQLDPNLQQTTQWVQIVLQNSQAMLAFAEPFPELKVWLAAQIDAAAKDRKN